MGQPPPEGRNADAPHVVAVEVSAGGGSPRTAALRRARRRRAIAALGVVLAVAMGAVAAVGLDGRSAPKPARAATRSVCPGRLVPATPQTSRPQACRTTIRQLCTPRPAPSSARRLHARIRRPASATAGRRSLCRNLPEIAGVL